MPAQDTRRDFLKTAAAVGVTAGLVPFAAPRIVSDEAKPNPAVPTTRKKKIIAWGGIDWYSPEKVQTNIRKIEELPFDGTVLQGFKATQNGQEVMFDWLCFGKDRFEREQLAPTIATLKNIKFQRFTENLLRYNVTPGDVD